MEPSMGQPGAAASPDRVGERLANFDNPSAVRWLVSQVWETSRRLIKKYITE